MISPDGIPALLRIAGYAAGRSSRYVVMKNKNDDNPLYILITKEHNKNDIIKFKSSSRTRFKKY